MISSLWGMVRPVFPAISGGFSSAGLALKEEASSYGGGTVLTVNSLKFSLGRSGSVSFCQNFRERV